MKRYKQANWDEPLIFELGREDRVGFAVSSVEPEVSDAVGEIEELVPTNMVRNQPPGLPEVSEVEVVRHYTRLSQMNYGVNAGIIYPLGSCTMKYNPVINEVVASHPKATELHPDQDEATIQGILEIMYQLKWWFLKITGMDEASLQPVAGAHGEFLGNLLMRAYHADREELEERNEIVIPDSAHGTNPASAIMTGFRTVEVPSGDDGCMDIEALRSVVGEQTAGLMLTNPNTLGIFEDKITEIAEIIHGVGGLMYYDGANLNAILGKCRPGDMGFDIVHVNLHKTFSTPHGGGGPGSGPVGVKSFLADFLPVPTVEKRNGAYTMSYDRPKTVGKICGYYGNVSPILKAYTYILSLGGLGLREVSEIAVLNSNYIANKLKQVKGLTLPYAPDKPRKHEAVLSSSRLVEETGVSTLNIAKKLLDYGIHAPTVYFPLIVPEALMVEPTETEPVESLDAFIDAVTHITELAYSDPENVLNAPQNTVVGKLDEARAAHPRTICLSWSKYCRLIPET